MKRKMLLSLLIVLGLLLVAGCEQKTNQSSDKNIPEAKEDKKTKEDDSDIIFNFSGSFQKMSFKYPEKAQYSNLGTYVIMDYMNGSEFVFRIGINFFSGKTIEEAMTDASIESVGTTTINGITWNAYEGDNPDGNKTKNFAYYYDGGTYTVTIIYAKDIRDAINDFMNSISFE